MLTSNPAGMVQLNLAKKHSIIAKILQGKEDQFVLNIQKAVSRVEFTQYIQATKPNILHFSGHGEDGKYGGLIVQNEDKNGYDLISPTELSNIRHFPHLN